MTYAHTSGQHDGGCQACLDDEAFGGTSPICHDAQPADDTDADLLVLCAWCGHTVELMPMPLALPMTGECE